MAELSADTLLGGRVQLAQAADGYRVAIDPILLAAATPVERGGRVLDAGCGTGAAMLCLLTRDARCTVVGVEAAVEVADLARTNLAMNGLSPRGSVITADLAALPEDIDAQPFDIVMTNPPFLPARAGTPSPRRQRQVAHVESMTLRSWIAVCLGALRPGGWLVMIQRADRTAEICAALAEETGEVGLMPLWPKPDTPLARRLIVRARKGSRGPTRLGRGLVLHEADGRYTEAAEAMLRHGAPLEWPR
jgi:tRNA1(Val) A37 N6-methylase TrmN6